MRADPAFAAPVLGRVEVVSGGLGGEVWNRRWQRSPAPDHRDVSWPSWARKILSSRARLQWSRKHEVSHPRPALRSWQASGTFTAIAERRPRPSRCQPMA